MFSQTFPLSSATALLLSAAFAMCAQETITISEPRALGKLAVELEARGYLVTYEEAPYDAEAELSTTTYRDGTQFRAPVFAPVTFHLPASAAAPASSAASPPPQDLGLIKESVGDYNKSGNPGNFVVVFEGKYAHVVPAARKIKGRLEPFDPILSTKVVLAPQPRLCDEAMHDLFAQLKLVRGVTVVQGNIPMNLLLRHTCSITGNDLTARQALIQILAQMAADHVPGLPDAILAWQLCHDANWDEYFLSTTPVRAENAMNNNARPANPGNVGEPARPAPGIPGISFGAVQSAPPAKEK